MCQPRSEGGRRCPIHRHDSLAYIQLAEKDTGLNKRQVENIFRELSREGRHTPDPTEEQWRTVLTNFQTSMETRSGHRNIKNSLTKAFDNFTIPDGKTFYTLQKLMTATTEKANNLEILLNSIAREKGMPIANVKRRFNRYSNAVDISRGSETPEGYSQRAYLFAKNNNLPYDKASVVAIEQLKNLPMTTNNPNIISETPAAPVRRVNPIYTPDSTFINSVGYNPEGGRLEVTFQRNPETIYAYQNVPEEVWNRMVDDQNEPSNNLGSVYSRYIRNEHTYQYSSEAEAERDSLAIRCQLCGQFASQVSHTCPERVAEEIENNQIITQARNSDEPSAPTIETDDVDDESIPHVSNEATVENVSNENTPTITEIPSLAIYDPLNPAIMHSLGLDNTGINVFQVDTDDIKTANNIPSSATVLSTKVVRNRESLQMYQASASNGIRYYIKWNGKEQELREDLESSNPDKKFVLLVYYTRGSSKYIVVSDIYASDAVVKRHMIVNRETGNTEKLYFGTSPEIKVNEELSFTEGDIRLAREDIDSRALSLPSRTSVTKSFNYDANCSTQPSIKLPTLANMRSAYAKLESDEVNSFVINLRVIYDGRPRTVSTPFGDSMPFNLTTVVDDQGYKQLNNQRGINLYGRVEFIKNSEGKITAAHNPKILKCSCQDYSQKRYCDHVADILRKADNLLYQSLNPSSIQGSTAAPIRDEAVMPYMTAALARRADLSVIAPSNNREKAKFTFNTINGNRQRQTAWATSNISSLAGNAIFIRGNERAGTFKEYSKALELSKVIKSTRYLHTVDKLNDVQIALNRGEVTIPIAWSSMNYPSTDGGASIPYVSGNITYDKNDNNDPYIKGSNLQCQCPIYRETYDCEHVRGVKSMGLSLLQTSSRNYTPHNPTESLPLNSRILSVTDSSGNPLTDTRSGFTLSEIYKVMQEETSVVDTDTVRKRQAIAKIRENRRAAEREAREATSRQMRQTAQTRARLSRELDSWKRQNPRKEAEFEAFRADRMSKWETVDPSYVENPNLATDAITAALARKRRGENPIKFRTSGVLDGMSDGPVGRKFGIELEFDIGRGHDRSTALHNIGRELHEAGLTTTSRQVSYHSAGRNGYATWSFERDATVDAELVSPILDDSPESWEQIRKATEIITRNGGKATTRAGSHVHVSTGSYENSSAKRAEVLRFNREHQDMIYRLASDPQRGTHRGWRWCAPNVNDNAGEINSGVDAGSHLFSGNHSSHGVGLNMGAMGSNLKSSNIEFRMWDATLDPAAIQAQVMLSAAITDYAERSVIKDGKSKVRESVHPIGQARRSGKDVHDLTEDTGFSSFIDKLFRKNEDKAQITSLFAVTNWQNSSR